MQAAVASNTQALVQQNIVARVMRVSQQPIPAAAVISPCGQLVACHEADTFMVRHIRTNRQIFSQLMPYPVGYPDTFCWSHDSSQLALNRLQGVFALHLASGVMTELPSAERTRGEHCSWAPSAQSLALVRGRDGPRSMLFLYQGSGAELLLAYQLLHPIIWEVVWANNSRSLALVGCSGICILDTVTRALSQLPRPDISGNSLVAWSPRSWDAPHLLCTTHNGDARFVDHKAALTGRCESTVKGARTQDMVWGEHGVVILTDTSLWLFHVCKGLNGLELNPRQQVMAPGLIRPMHSPDQVHVCMLQEVALHRGRSSHYDLFILNIVSGRQALFRLPESMLDSVPLCSWTSSGYSLAVTMLTDPDRRERLYKQLRFVF